MDFFHLDDLLTEEQRMVREMVRKFVDREVLPIIGEYWLRGEFPMQLVPRMAELGFFGPTLPEEYGGQRLDYTSYGLMMMELERGDSGVRSFASVQSSLAMTSIYLYGSDEQKKKYLPAMARGKILGCFGLSEPDAGSDPGSMRTVALREGNTWVIHGTKLWITNGSIADVAVIWAKDREGIIRGFLVEKGTPGFTARDIKTKISLRASITSELSLDEVRVPDENRLPLAEGLGAPLRVLNYGRYGVAWGAVGAAQAAFEEALAYAKERIQFGRPIAGFQIIQQRLVDMLAKLTSIQLMALRVGQMMDQGTAQHHHISLFKRQATRYALDIARASREILGANGITVEYHSMRHAANLESTLTYEGTYDIHTLIVGKAITGLEAYGG